MLMKLVFVLLVLVAIFFLVTYNSLTNDKNRIELAEVVLRDYNNKVEKFPTSIVANMFNFPKMHIEEFDEGL